MYQALCRALAKPGRKDEVRSVAQTQAPRSYIRHSTESGPEQFDFLDEQKPRLLDRVLDAVVRASGSEVVFFTILTSLIIWALLGIPYGRTDDWQIVISNVQAILSYSFDSLLVRQQLNIYDQEMLVAAQMQSRLQSYRRMFKVYEGLGQEERVALIAAYRREARMADELQQVLPEEGGFGRFITRVSHVLGNIVTVALFWVAVFVWIAIGHRYDYSNTWQLYMNSASSALMMLYFAFLANIRERHTDYNKQCLRALFKTDAHLELRLRSLTKDDTRNPEITIPAPKITGLQRTIFFYADFVGTLMGIAILLTVIIAWLAVGPVFHFSADWWLFIGTYAGLIGMFDGFVLRNMQSRLNAYVQHETDVIHTHDQQIFSTLGLPPSAHDSHRTPSLTERVSIVIDTLSAHELTVAIGLLTILGLLAGASAMRWSLTGQLLCNVPPSLIESFFMMILVTGHNLNDDAKRAELRLLYERRVCLARFVDVWGRLGGAGETGGRDKAEVDSNFLRAVGRE